jgi:hypothetical protein
MGIFIYCLFVFLFGIIFYLLGAGKKPPTTLTTLPPEPTDWVTIDTDKGHWWDGIHEMD